MNENKTDLVKSISLSLMGFFAFVVIVTRFGFLLNTPVNQLTLFSSLVFFLLFLILYFRTSAVVTIVGFLLILVTLSGVSLLMSQTYDTSWDGQGYHQSAVIAFQEGWNPIYQADIHFVQRLPSQIFAESYPSALWEVQADIYALTGKINSAKVVNFAIGIVSFCVVYALLRKISLGRLLSVIAALLIVIQPLYVIQFLSFMQDGFGYQMITIAIASLVYFILDKRSNWALWMFVLSEIFLASTKYSHLPMVLMLGIIFLAVAGNRFLNKDYVLNKQFWLFILSLGFLSIVFAYIPYGRNALFHHSPFYPTNIPELNGSVTYNNLPHNIEDKGKIVQLFYGLFSASQRYESSDNRSEANVAELKLPFTFSNRELSDAAKLYNNRAGAQGPLYSGILLLALLFCIVMSFKAQTMNEKYVFYAMYFVVGFLIVTSFLVPTPNLVRYTSQTQLLPFVLFIPVLAIFKNNVVRFCGVIIILLLLINNALYTTAVIEKTADENQHINNQFEQMRESGITYKVRAQQFYSGYILLNEQHIPFTVTDHLDCKHAERLYASSTTTEYCGNTISDVSQ